MITYFDDHRIDGSIQFKASLLEHEHTCVVDACPCRVGSVISHNCDHNVEGIQLVGPDMRTGDVLMAISQLPMDQRVRKIL